MLIRYALDIRKKQQYYSNWVIPSSFPVIHRVLLDDHFSPKLEQLSDILRFEIRLLVSVTTMKYTDDINDDSISFRY